MRTKTTTFARLKRFVESLGLTYGRGPRQHEYFQEPGGEILLTMPKYHPNQLVRPVHLVGLRYLLIGRGWVEAEDFDRFLDQKETA